MWNWESNKLIKRYKCSAPKNTLINEIELMNYTAMPKAHNL